MTAALVVDGLRVEDFAGRLVVDDVSFSVEEGEALAIVGESGSGKTTIALSLLGWTRRGLQVAGGSVRIRGTELMAGAEAEVRALRGRLVAYVPQVPASALSPSMRIGAQLGETVAGLTDAERHARVAETLEIVELPSDRGFQRRFPHQLSGGQQQRIALALALVNRPAVVVLDEPTTGLDVITQEAVLQQVERLRREFSLAVVSISHDLAVVARHTERTLVMHDGRVVEQGPSHRVLTAPTHPYTRTLVAAVVDHRAAVVREPVPAEAPQSAVSPPLLAVERLHASHVSKSGRVVAAEAISFAVEAGECLAVVGQSGSGKTTIARSVVGLHAPDSGRILLDGTPLAAGAKARSREQLARVQLVFQDPFASLNPRRSVGNAIARPLRVLRGLKGAPAHAEVAELLERVRLRPQLADAYPGELSGGECQRVAIARGLAAAPDLLVCDEITSSLDVSVQASVLELIDELRRTLGLALVFISHDLGVVGAVGQRVLVLERGTCREYGPVQQVLAAPRSDYARRLVDAAPSLSTALDDRRSLERAEVGE